MNGGLVIGGMLGRALVTGGFLPGGVAVPVGGPLRPYVNPRAIQLISTFSEADAFSFSVDPRGIKVLWSSPEPRSIRLISTGYEPKPTVDPRGMKLIH